MIAVAIDPDCIRNTTVKTVSADVMRSWKEACPLSGVNHQDEVHTPRNHTIEGTKRNHLHTGVVNPVGKNRNTTVTKSLLVMIHHPHLNPHLLHCRHPLILHRHRHRPTTSHRYKLRSKRRQLGKSHPIISSS